MPIIPFVGSQYSEAGIPERVLEKLQRIHQIRRKNFLQTAAATLSDGVELSQNMFNTHVAVTPSNEQEDLLGKDSMPVEPHIARAYEAMQQRDDVPFSNVETENSDVKSASEPEL